MYMNIWISMYQHPLRYHCFSVNVSSYMNTYIHMDALCTYVDKYLYAFTHVWILIFFIFIFPWIFQLSPIPRITRTNH
jgi:hypothetical protein